MRSSLTTLTRILGLWRWVGIEGEGRHPLCRLQMETFHLLHLASCWPRKSKPQGPGSTGTAAPPSCEPAEAHVVESVVAPATHSVPQSPSIPHITAADVVTGPRIRAAAVQMIFADRTSQEFITPEQVRALENDAAIGLLEAIIGYEIPDEVRTFIGGCHGATQSNWPRSFFTLRQGVYGNR